MTRRRKPEEVPTVPQWVSPPIAMILSLIVPGLGQMLVGQIRRGLVLLFSLASIVGLLIWRMNLAARREEGAWNIFVKAISVQPLLGIMTLGAIILWLWVAWDAFVQARTARAAEKPKGGISVFALVLLLYFGLGWQIVEINLYQMVTGFDDALPAMSQVLWPWEKAFVREEAVVSASASIQVPCSDNPPPPPQEVPGQPYLVADPTCGDMTTQDSAGNPIPGTTLSVTGRGFAPDTVTQIWWADPLGNQFRIRQAGEYLTTVTDSEGAFELDVIIPYRLIPPSAGEGPQLHEIEARQSGEVGPLKASPELKLAIEKMIETIFLGMVATLFGIIFAIPVSFLAARNLMSGSWIMMTLYYLVRTLLNIIRSIEPLIWAIIAVLWVGLGPFAGVIALTLHSVAALGKLYSEAIESIDPGPIEAVHATGANRLQTIVYAVVPQVLPPFISFTIYRWDINVRMSTIIGAVGGGGIGFLLIQWIRLLDYQAAGIAVWFIAITVAILDYVSSEIRERYV
ncbi:MAG: phosphonate ABC transporter, permease protein PhnE [Anaerolineae bacterium]|nr:phosphonate ABC transporter, permease protein PhnE [Anaerolineae bacterium]